MRNDLPCSIGSLLQAIIGCHEIERLGRPDTGMPEQLAGVMAGSARSLDNGGSETSAKCMRRDTGNAGSLAGFEEGVAGIANREVAT